MAKSALARLDTRRAQLEEHRRLTQAARQRDPAPYAPGPGVFQLTKSEPEVGNAHLATLRAAVACSKESHA